MSKSFPFDKVPQFAIEPDADPVLAGSREDDAPQNAYRGNREHLNPGMAGNTGNGGISQTAPHLQEKWEKAAAKAAGSGGESASGNGESKSRLGSTEPRGTRKVGDKIADKLTDNK